MKTAIDRPLRTLPADDRLRFQTRYMVTLTHGVHMLSFCLPGNGPVRRISEQVAEITQCQPKSSYQTGDFEIIAILAPPDPEAEGKLNAVIDLIWRAASFQQNPSIRSALVDLVSGFTEPRRAIV